MHLHRLAVRPVPVFALAGILPGLSTGSIHAQSTLTTASVRELLSNVP